MNKKYRTRYVQSPEFDRRRELDVPYTGKDYWTNVRAELDEANAEFARRMGKMKYEDVERMK